MFKNLDFRPFPGLASPHLQIFLAYFGPHGDAPPSRTLLISLGNGDYLSCEISTPPHWKPQEKTVALVHGLGGSHESGYMIRLARKLFEAGCRVARINLRDCGTGRGMSRLPYNSGNSEDVFSALKGIKKETPASPIHLIGFSLGGNIILKLAGELGKEGLSLIDRLIAVCAPLDLEKTLQRILEKKNAFYHRYFLKTILSQGQKWVQDCAISSLYEFDQKIIAPLWGYGSAEEYYDKCSSSRFLSNIHLPCDLLFAEDDPLIDHMQAQEVSFSPTTSVWLTPGGSHMAFIGPAEKEHGLYWMDKALIHWVLQGRLC